METKSKNEEIWKHAKIERQRKGKRGLEEKRKECRHEENDERSVIYVMELKQA